MKVEFSFLCGYSYAWKAGYKPEAFKRIEKVLVDEKEREFVLKNRKLVEQIIDSYGKLGFLFLSRDYIRQVNGKIPLSHIYVHYHLYNFIYDSKTFLDSVAVMLNDFYSVGETRGHTDFKHETFREKVMDKEPKLEKIVRKHEDWFVTVATWRDNLIHKFSTLIAPSVSLTHWPADEELNRFFETKPSCVMLIEPRPYLSPNIPELKKKYGIITREIDPFCNEWIDKACDMYNQVCNVLSEALK